MKHKAMIILLFSVLLLQNSCAQNTMSTEYRDKIKNDYKNVKTYDYNPTYQVLFDKFNCPMELYVNDVLVLYLDGAGKSAGEQTVQIPQYILKSGVQIIRLKINPLLDKNKNFEKFVSREAKLKVRITYRDFQREKKELQHEVFKVELPKIETDVPFLEFKREFIATVPYELVGWSNGVDLSKEDPKELEQEVMERMDEIADFYRDKDIEGLAREHYNFVKEFNQAYYFNTKENSASWESEITEALNESKSVEVLSGTMKLMANGKLVTILVSDGAFKNKSIIRSDVGQYYDFYPQYFYRPSKGAKLQVIR